MSSSITDIKGLTVLVTGGASGLGQATARRLVRKGANVVICDLPSSKGKEVAEEIGENCIFIPTDVTKETDVQEALNVTKSKFHKLDVVVNCAGMCIDHTVYNFKDDVPYPLQDYQKVIDVNTIGTLNTIRLAVGLIAKNQPDTDGQRGVIINTASVAAFEGTPLLLAYAASKAAVAGMTLPLARDLGSQGIRCCAIAPGLIDTPLLRGIPEAVLEKLVKQMPFPHRFGEPDEFAHLVQSIIENHMLNGCTIRLDGSIRVSHTLLQ